MAEAGATRYLRKAGWLKLYRSEAQFQQSCRRELDVAARFGIPLDPLDPDAARVLEPSLAPVFATCRVLDGARRA